MVGGEKDREKRQNIVKEEKRREHCNVNATSPLPLSEFLGNNPNLSMSEESQYSSLVILLEVFLFLRMYLR